MRHNLRHLRVFLAVVDTSSVTKAAEICHVSQSAVTQGISKIERAFGTVMFKRTHTGLFTTSAGDALAARVRRAFLYLDPALAELHPRLCTVATFSQLKTLIAVCEAQNFSLAAKRMELAQPTVHRAVTQLQLEATRPLFERTSYDVIATRVAQSLALAARLAFAELAQAEVDLADMMSEETGKVVIGAMPLARSFVLPRAIALFRQTRPTTAIHVLEGSYSDLLTGLRRGDIDFLIGALREPAPIEDVEQRTIFDDTLAIVAATTTRSPPNTKSR